MNQLSYKQQQEDQGRGRGGGGGGEASAPTTHGHDTLSILYTNAQSIVGKIDELSCTSSELKPDLILLTETWCNDSVSDAFLSIPDYELHHRLDREDTAGGRGGGLLVYSKKGIKVLSLDKVQHFHQYSRLLDTCSLVLHGLVDLQAENQVMVILLSSLASRSLVRV